MDFKNGSRARYIGPVGEESPSRGEEGIVTILPPGNKWNMKITLKKKECMTLIIFGNYDMFEPIESTPDDVESIW